MATIYNRGVDNDLEFTLRRSIDLIKERKERMGKGRRKNGRERASISRERRLALALRAVLDANEFVGDDVETQKETSEAVNDAKNILDALGYGSLVGIPKRLKELNEQLAKAMEAGDGKEIARLGLELDKTKAGKFVAPSAASKSSRRSAAKSSIVNTVTAAEDVGVAAGASAND